MHMNIILGLPTMVVCLFLQSLLLMIALHYYKDHERLVNDASFWSSMIVINVVMLLLLIGNLAQIAIWGLLFMLLDEFQQFDTAFYHSAVNFATLGYGDIVMSPERRLLGPLEAVNGVLMIGLSTAVLMAVLQDSWRKTMRARSQGED